MYKRLLLVGLIASLGLFCNELHSEPIRPKSKAPTVPVSRASLDLAKHHQLQSNRANKSPVQTPRVGLPVGAKQASKPGKPASEPGRKAMSFRDGQQPPASQPPKKLDVSAVTGKRHHGTGDTQGAKVTQTSQVVIKNFHTRSRIKTIAIDAGHGGKDAGALGSNGTMEKDVVFAIARILAGMIRAEPDMRPLMVRKGDEFIDLQQRTEIARRGKADLLVSLHADSGVNAEARGSSVFTLSPHGATSVAARWLADRENAADLVGGVKLNDKSKVLASVLLDLSQNATLEASDQAALLVLNELKKNHDLHQPQVQKAGFVVLKSPDVPSILVETAFISNPEDEKNLRSRKYQEMVARSVFNGIRSYFGRQKADVPAPMVLKNVSSKLFVVASRP